MFRITSLKAVLFPSPKIFIPRSFVTQAFRCCLNKKTIPCVGILRKNPTSNNLIFTRCMAIQPSKFLASKKFAEIQRKDGVPPNYFSIYRSDLANYFGGAQLLILFLATGFVSIIGANYLNWNESQTEPINVEKRSDTDVFGIRKRMKLEPTFEPDSWTLAFFVALSMSLYVCLSQLLRRIPIRMYASTSGNVVSVHLSPFFPGVRAVRDFPAGTLRRVPSKMGYFKDIHYQDPHGRHYFLFDSYFRQPIDLENLMEKEN